VIAVTLTLIQPKNDDHREISLRSLLVNKKKELRAGWMAPAA